MSTSPALDRRHRDADWPFKPDDVVPLLWWRGSDLSSSGKAEIATLQTALHCLSVLAFPDAPRALAGDDSVAVRIALRVSVEPEAPAWLIDWANSLLLLCALKGSATAMAVLDSLRRRLRTTRPSIDWRAS